MRRPGRTLAALAATGVALIAIGVGLAAPGLSTPRSSASDAGATRERLDDRLRQLVEKSRRIGADASVAEARRSGLAVQDGRVRVIVTGAGATRAIAASGGTVEATTAGLVQALVEPADLPSLAASADVEAVRPPASFSEAAVTGEGMATTGAAQFSVAGTGAGTTIAVVDLNFAGYATAQAQGELPAGAATFDHCSGGLATGDGHGTAVAEIVHEVAPGAQLLLICVNSEVTLAQAVDDAIAQGAVIISHSVQWFNTGRGDGTGGAGSPDSSVAKARAHGILWVNAAGNAARTHWGGTFVDTNGNGRHEFAPGDEGNGMTVTAGAHLCARLKWDEWPTSSSDYDLFLERTSDGVVLASSQNRQSTTPSAPTEVLCWTNTGATDMSVDAVVTRVSASSSSRLDLFTDARLQYQVADHSIVEPASSPEAIAVGAACWSGTTIEPYSSRGPAIDGRIKPDLIGPDAVSTLTSGPSTSCTNGFTGTSAAAPYVAGLLALRRSAQPGVSAAALEASLATDATDLGTEGKDNTSGAGLVWLPTPSATPGQVAYSVAGESPTDRDVVVSSPNGEHPVRITGAGSDDTDPVIDPSGGRVAFTRTSLEGADVYVVNSDGSGLTRLTTSPGQDIQPAWSPDGSRIAFASERDGDFGLWVMNANGTGQVRLTVGTARSPSWSPDGARIAYSSLSPGSGYDIWVANADGTLPARLTTSLSDETLPAWSASGRIAYVVGGTIRAIDADGNDDAVLVQSDAQGAAGDPAWSPDGSGLVFVKGTTLWRSSSTGAGPSRLTPPIGASAPAWALLPPPPPPPPSGGGGGDGGGGAAPDVVLTNVADHATARVGDTIVFRLEARLGSPAPATNVVVTDELPANVELVSTRVNRGAGCTGTRTVVCNLDFLSGSLVASVEIVARVTGPGEIVAVATAQVAPGDADLSSNVATARVQPTAPATPPRAPSSRTGVSRTGTAKADVLRGTPFADVLRGLGGRDRLLGLGGADRLFGGPGNDTLNGGLGSDTLIGGDGNDTISARDGARDSVDCGRGRDVVVADRFDRVASNCEIVRR